MEEKVPEFGGMGCPIWWHHHGSEMSIAAQGLCNDLLLLQGSVAELLIQRHQTNWLLTWKVIHGPKTAVSGTTSLSSDELLAAFGVSHTYATPSHSLWLISRYGGTAACQFCFIRFQNWLNIPCPGTGHDGDPNISIELNEKIIKAVFELVYRNRWPKSHCAIMRNGFLLYLFTNLLLHYLIVFAPASGFLAPRTSKCR